MNPDSPLYLSLPRSRHARKAGPGLRHKDGHKTGKARPPTLEQQIATAMMTGVPAPAVPFKQHTNPMRSAIRKCQRYDRQLARMCGTKAANRHYSMTAMTGW